jgi:hypothetical protein
MEESLLSCALRSNPDPMIAGQSGYLMKLVPAENIPKPTIFLCSTICCEIDANQG